MTNAEKIEVMKHHPLFDGLNDSQLEFVAKLTKEKIYKPNTIIIRHGDPADAVYITYKGLIKIYVINEQGRQMPSRTVGEKHFVGDLGVVDHGTVPGTVETILETHTLIISKADFRKIIEMFPVFAMNLLYLMAVKTRSRIKQHEINYSLQLKERTLETLHTLAPYFPHSEIILSHEELAGILGATRARVTEILNEYVKEKKIVLSNRKIKVL
jgi:CRP/FNR family cyclic AMP-dependent transcriptional regulator